MEILDAGIHDATRSSKTVRDIRTDNTAMAKKENDTCETSSERPLVDTGVVGRGEANRRTKQQFCVYCIRSLELNRIKVGITGRLNHRISSYKTHCPDNLELIGSVLFETRELARQAELNFVNFCKTNSTHLHGEWVKEDSIVIEHIKSTLEALDGKILQKQERPGRPRVIRQCVMCKKTFSAREMLGHTCSAETKNQRHDLQQDIKQKITRPDVDYDPEYNQEN